jgi:hypothetical protein
MTVQECFHQWMTATAAAGGLVDDFAPGFRSFQFLFHGNREISSGEKDVGKDHEREVQSKEPEILVAPFPHPDRRLLPHSPATLQQRRANGSPGSGCRGRGNSVSPYPIPSMKSLPSPQKKLLRLP